MELNLLQNEVDNWIKKYGVRYFDELTNLALLMEEVGELARIMARSHGEQSFKKSDSGKDLGDEICDVLFVLTCIANQSGVDLQKSFDKNLEKKSKRDSQRHKRNRKLN